MCSGRVSFANSKLLPTNWSADGAEVLFSAGNSYASLKVHAVSLSGRGRVALESAGGLTIHDVRADGRWLATRDDQLWGMPVLSPGERAERDLSWLDGSNLPIVSEDGKSVVFTEQSGRAGVNYAACLRRVDGSPVVRLGDGGETEGVILVTRTGILLHCLGDGLDRSSAAPRSRSTAGTSPSRAA